MEEDRVMWLNILYIKGLGLGFRVFVVYILFVKEKKDYIIDLDNFVIYKCDKMWVLLEINKVIILFLIRWL